LIEAGRAVFEGDNKAQVVFSGWVWSSLTGNKAAKTATGDEPVRYELVIH
jgi:hypothetical protein